MRVEITEGFNHRLEKQIDYIAKDSLARAKQFKKELLSSLRNIPAFPYKSRKSIYFDDENVRDMIFKGYTITYTIRSDTIEVFGFTKYQNSLE